MLKIINYPILLLLAILAIYSSAQSQSDTTRASASISKSDIIGYRLHLNPLLNSNKFFLGQKDLNISLRNSLDGKKYITSGKNPGTITGLKIQLQDYLSKRRNLLPDYNLGDFGTYLGYANTLVAVILAIAHISKYGFK